MAVLEHTPRGKSTQLIFWRKTVFEHLQVSVAVFPRQVVEDQKGPTFARFQQILLSLSDRVGQRVFMSALWVVRLRTGMRVSGEWIQLACGGWFRDFPDCSKPIGH